MHRLWQGALLAVLLAAITVADAKPPESRIKVKGLQAATEILVDRWGVPHIYATSLHDAFFAQGWNAARDRLWQIDLWRRSGVGELAAVLGPSYVDQDRAIRLFVYRGDMDKEWAAYGADARRHAEAFVAGINAYVTRVRSGAAALPMEFKLANYPPAFWKAEDVVRIRNHGLVLAVAPQLIRAQVVCKTASVAAITQLPFEVSPSWTPILPQGLDMCSIPANVLDRYKLAQKPVVFGPAKPPASAGTLPQAPAAIDTRFDDALQGSNNWVVAPSRSTTNRPILANDPHRSLGVPSLRYLAHLVAPGLNVIGAGEPALPGVTLGHNEHIAFGFTIFPIAQEDLYVYDTNPANPNAYRFRDTWEAMRVVHEPIAVRGAQDARAELKFTRHGPVVFEDPVKQRAYAVRATWLDTGGAPYFGSMRYLQARNIQEFAAALKHWGQPGENHIYADTSGRIGWFPAGFTPQRPNTDGLLPLPGDGRYEWAGYMDHDLLPSEIDPARGYIATANQMNLPKGYPYAQRRVSFTWQEPTRFERISAVLDGLPKISLQDSEQLQNDDLSVPGLRLIGVLKQIATEDRELRDTIDWLTEWNGRVTADSPQTALFEVWCARHLVPAAIAQAAPAVPESFRDLVAAPIPANIVDLIEQPDGRLGTDPRRARDELVLRTLAAALRETRERLGPDRAAWRWGKLAIALFEHPLAPLAGDQLRLKMNVGPAPKSGDGTVVGMSHYRMKDFRTTAGASVRMVLDVGRWDDSVAVNTPGQSGDPSSPHYRDLFPLWLEGKYFPLVYSRAAVESAAGRRILLEPAVSSIGAD